jgi:hypothetical protein
MSKKRKAWRASQQRKVEAEPAEAAIPPHRLRGFARREWIEARVQEMYQRMVGDSMDKHIRSCMHTADAFDSQMAAAKGEGEAWGPEITPYENRMTGSLLARLQREKRTWQRELRQMIERALDEEAALEAEEAAMEPKKEETRARRASDGCAYEKSNEAGPDEASENDGARVAEDDPHAIGTGGPTRATPAT